MAQPISKMLCTLLHDGACCVVCDSTNHVIECPNGHHQCLKCMLKRYQCVLAEACPDEWLYPGEGMKCFQCRQNINNIYQQAGDVYHKMLLLVVLKGSYKSYAGKTIPTDLLSLYIDGLHKEGIDVCTDIGRPNWEKYQEVRGFLPVNI